MSTGTIQGPLSQVNDHTSQSAHDYGQKIPPFRTRNLEPYHDETAALLAQLRQLHADLTRMSDRDPEQEVRGPALHTMDYVISEARQNVPEGSTLGDQIVELVSAETIESDEPIRAVDALIIVGQLLAVYENEEQRKRNISNGSAARRALDGRR